jgi:hypothetical protein
MARAFGADLEMTAANRVAVTKAVMLRSVNGAAVTTIRGYHDPDPTSDADAVRCVYLASGASLVGFTLTNGSGGVWCESATAVISNCVITGNSAHSGGGATGGTLYNSLLTGNSAKWGGGAVSSTLNNCTLYGNRAGDVGGGAIDCILKNCAVSSNSATYGVGGTIGGKLENCIVYYNTSSAVDNYSGGVFNHSCTTPLPTNGVANIEDTPQFINLADDLRLHSGSPCINAGSNSSAPAGPDLDGNTRISGGVVDMGAYEFQFASSLISQAWLKQYNLARRIARTRMGTD